MSQVFFASMAFRFNDAMQPTDLPDSFFADVSASVNAAVVPLPPPSVCVVPLVVSPVVLSPPPPPVGFAGCFPPPPPLPSPPVSSVSSFVRVVPRG